MSGEGRVAVGIVVERRRLASPWADEAWLPVAALPAAAAAAPWTVLARTPGAVTYYAGAAEVALHRTETANYRDNLASGRPRLWVVLRPTPRRWRAGAAGPGRAGMTTTGDGGGGPPGFLGRWSRLKRERDREGALERDAAPPAAADPAAAAGAVPAGTPGGPRPPAEPLPDPATLGADDVAAPFLRPGVPGAVREAALRRLWAADPAIRDFGGPADYAWDWNVPGGVPGFGPLRAAADEVARMAERILGGGDPPEADRPAPAAPVPALAPTAGDAATAPPPAMPAPATLQPEAGPVAAPPDPAPAAVPWRPGRRHGGALPE